MTPVQQALLILLIPLASAAIIALFLRSKGGLATIVSVVAAAALAGLSLSLIAGGERFAQSWEWMQLGGLTISIGFKFDDLAALMLFVVSFVGFFIHLFSTGYMHDDKARARYFGGLSIFMFSMIGIVFADNLFMMFIFWELVGFSSYLLINHYHEKQSAADASKKAFIVNRVGDFGFLLGIILCYWTYGTVNLTELGMISDSGGLVYSKLIPLLLFCGAVGKSAQMPLQVWLPDAMEGPTPVSALIHAATMVAAGIFMLCRIEVLMVPEALNIIMWIGTATALYAALCAIVQSDIKKVLAYSTLSQLGYMVAAFGLGSLVFEQDGKDVLIFAGVGAAMFHLTTHAFFKALLFLGSGSVIHGCHHEQDIFQMGGLFSKDAILLLAMRNNTAVFAILLFTAILTAFYMVRMWKLVFFGETRSDNAAKSHESGLSMTLPLMVLAGLAIIGGYTGIYSKLAGSVADLVPHAHGSEHTIILLTSIVVLLIGSLGAWAYYKPGTKDTLEQKSNGLFNSLTTLKESFDALYGYYVAKVQQRFAMLLNFLEQIFLAGLIIRGFSGLVGLLGLGARALHVGSLHAYVHWFLLGIVLLWVLTSGLF